MKRIFWAMLLVLALGTAGCSGVVSTPEPVPTITLDQPNPVLSGKIKASAEVVPSITTSLSFVIPGPVKEVTVQEGETVQAGQVLAILSTPELEYAIAAAEASVAAAENEVTIQNYSRKKYNDKGQVTYLKGPPEFRERAAAQLEQAQASLETAKATLAQGTLLAPFNGTVVSVETKSSEYVQPGQVVIVLADLNSLQFETTDLGEKYIPNVTVGQSANIFVDALNTNINGVVTKISPISETLGGDVIFRVTLKPEEKVDGLLWGMSAEIEITPEQQ